MNNAREETFEHRVALGMRLRELSNESLCLRLLEAELAADEIHECVIGEARRRLLVWTATPAEIDRLEEQQIEEAIRLQTPEERAELQAIADRGLEKALAQFLAAGEAGTKVES